MFSHCHHFDINGGGFNHVQGNQHNYHHNTTNHVRGSHNTYKTINRGNHNVTNNGVDHGWGWPGDYGADDDWDDDDDDFPPPPPHLQQPHRPRMPHAPSDPEAYGYDNGFAVPRHWESHPEPPRSAPPVMTENPGDRHHLNGPSPFHTQSYPPHLHPLDPSVMGTHPASLVQNNDTIFPTTPTMIAPAATRSFPDSQIGQHPLVAPMSSHSPRSLSSRNDQRANGRVTPSFSSAEATSSIPDSHRQSPPITISSGLRGSDNSHGQFIPGGLPTPATTPSQVPIQDSASAQTRISPQRAQLSSSERRRDFPVPLDTQPQSQPTDDNMAVDEDQGDDSAQR